MQLRFLLLVSLALPARSTAAETSTESEYSGRPSSASGFPLAFTFDNLAARGVPKGQTLQDGNHKEAKPSSFVTDDEERGGGGLPSALTSLVSFSRGGDVSTATFNRFAAMKPMKNKALAMSSRAKIAKLNKRKPKGKKSLIRAARHALANEKAKRAKADKETLDDYNPRRPEASVPNKNVRVTRYSAWAHLSKRPSLEDRQPNPGVPFNDAKKQRQDRLANIDAKRRRQIQPKEEAAQGNNGVPKELVRRSD